MQVTCQRCGARYQFSAEAIPAEGYQAQCSHCRNEFFVPGSRSDAAPSDTDDEAPPPPARRKSGLERLFAGDFHQASDPDDAKTTEAEKPLALELLHQGTMQQQEQGQTRAERASQHSVKQPEPARSQDPKRADAGKDESEAGAPAPAETKAPRKSGKQSLTDEIPYERPVGARSRRPMHRADLDPAQSTLPRPARARLRLFVGIASALAVALGVVVGVVRSKSLHAPTQVTPPIRIVREPSKAAQKSFADGMEALLEDNPDSLLAARTSFADAIGQDPEYTDAWAALGLSALLHSQDALQQQQDQDAAALKSAQALSHAAQQQGQHASSISLANEAGDSGGDGQAALALAASSLRLRAAVNDMQHLQDKRANAGVIAWQSLDLAATALMHAAQLPVQTPLLATVVALWHTGNPLGQKLVPTQLDVAVQLIGQLIPPERRSWLGPDNEQEATANNQPLGAPWAAWRSIARARLAAQQASATPPTADKQAAIAFYEGALRLDPSLRRAQYELARALIDAGRSREAGPILQKLAQSRQPHVRARALWQQWQNVHD